MKNGEMGLFDAAEGVMPGDDYKILNWRRQEIDVGRCDCARQMG